MTIMKYLISTGVCTTSELLALKKNDPKVLDSLVEDAKAQAKNLGIEITEK